jgi:hypothetical protein
MTIGTAGQARPRPVSPWSPITAVLALIAASATVYLALYLHTGRLALRAPSVPKPHVAAHFTGTIVILSQDSTEGCVTRPGHQGHLCASIYAHEPLTVGQQIAMVEVVVPATDGNVATVLVVNPTT